MVVVDGGSPVVVVRVVVDVTCLAGPLRLSALCLSLGIFEPPPGFPVCPEAADFFHHLVGAYSGYCGRSSVISNHGALLPTKMWHDGRTGGSSRTANGMPH